MSTTKKLLLLVFILILVVLTGYRTNNSEPIIITEETQKIAQLSGDVSLVDLQRIANEIECREDRTVYFVYVETDGVVYATIRNVTGTTTPYVIRDCALGTVLGGAATSLTPLEKTAKLQEIANETSCDYGTRYIYEQSGEFYATTRDPGATTTQVITTCK